MTRSLMALSLLWHLAATSMAQEVITRCGPSKGWTFYMSGQEEGWIEDGVSGGNITFVRDKNGEYDIVMKHAAGTMTARGDGARVIALLAQDGRYNIVAAYPMPTIEVYQLELDAAGNGTLLWSLMKNGSAASGNNQGSLFVSKCSR